MAVPVVNRLGDEGVRDKRRQLDDAHLPIGTRWVGPACHIRIARLIHRDPKPRSKAATAAQVGRLDQGRAGGVELRDERVEAASIWYSG